MAFLKGRLVRFSSILHTSVPPKYGQYYTQSHILPMRYNATLCLLALILEQPGRETFSSVFATMQGWGMKACNFCVRSSVHLFLFLRVMWRLYEVCSRSLVKIVFSLLS